MLIALFRSRRGVPALVVALVCLLVAVPSTTAAAQPPALPTRVAALGDSVTRATDVCCWYGDHPGQSWSTGVAAFDGISSHVERLRHASGAAVAGYNDAASGAKAADLPQQAATAVNQGADYVTILIGENDLCTSSAGTMTSTDDFRTSVEAAFETLHDGVPNARIFVGSMPNIHQLWDVLHTNWIAQAVWTIGGICPSMLSLFNTDAQRQAVLEREVAFNDILAATCAQYVMCKWDGNAAFDYQFSAAQVSSLDFFHPSLRGQAALAQITWQSSWWPSL